MMDLNREVVPRHATIPGPDGYGEQREVGRGELLEAVAVPGVAVPWTSRSGSASTERDWADSRTCEPPIRGPAQARLSGVAERSSRFSPTEANFTLAWARSPLPTVAMTTPSPQWS